MLDRANIVIVGGGITGCAMLYELAKARVGKVVLVEAKELASAITGESGGYIRKFNTNPTVGKLSSESFDYYNNFEKEVGGSCGFVKTGLVSRVSIAGLQSLNAQIDRLKSSGYNISVSVSPPVKSLMTGAYEYSSSAFIYEPDLGRIDTRLTCRSWADAAIKLGAQVLENTPVEKLLVRNGAVAGVTTKQGTIEADLVIVSAGARSNRLTDELPQIALPITAKSFQYNVYPNAAKYLDCAFMDNVAGFYFAALPNGDVFAGVLNENKHVPTTKFEQQVDNDSARHLHSLIERRFSWVKQVGAYEIRISYDAFTDDQEGIVTRFNDLPGLLVATGWSAGGIKIAPAIARQVTTLVASNTQAIALAS